MFLFYNLTFRISQHTLRTNVLNHNSNHYYSYKTNCTDNGKGNLNIKVDFDNNLIQLPKKNRIIQTGLIVKNIQEEKNDNLQFTTAVVAS